MLFPTATFAIFFLIVLPLSWLLMPKVHRWRPFIIVASYVFYAWWDWRFVLLLAVCTVWNQVMAVRIHRSEGAARRKALLWLALAGDLALLGYFKYYDFFVSSSDNLFSFVGLNAPIAVRSIVLPVGISFFTFMAISYVVDTYRRDFVPTTFEEFAVYLSFFPHLVAGPIVRPGELIPQLDTPRDPRRVDTSRAFYLIATGLFKKVVIANYLASSIVDPVFGAPGQHSSLEILIAIYAYAVQIYADFSGYTDIAIGIALLLGFSFPQNFNSPYAARSLQDFWRRWHMTLSRWLRDYVYISLGGSRKGSVITYRNLMLTMLLGGLWHGASWNFVLWGGLHGGALVVHKLYLKLVGERLRLPAAVTWPLTLLFVVLCWIPFRAARFGDTLVILKGMLRFVGGASFPPDAIVIALTLVVPAHLMGLWLARASRHEQPVLQRLMRAAGARLSIDPISSWSVRLGMQTLLGSFLVTLWLLLVLLSAETHTRPFIYFQF